MVKYFAKFSLFSYIFASDLCEKIFLRKCLRKCENAHFRFNPCCAAQQTQRKVERQVKVLIKNLAIFFPFPSKQFLPIHTAETMLVSTLTHPPPVPTPRVLTEPVLWQKSLAGTGKQTAKTWFGLDKQNENQPNYQRLLLLTVLPLNYFMLLMITPNNL